MEKKGSGLGLVFVLIIILLIVGIIISTMDFTKNTYTRGKLEEDIANGEVVKVTVNQRQNSNGGSVLVEKKNGEEKTLYVTDVTKETENLRRTGTRSLHRSSSEGQLVLKSAAADAGGCGRLYSVLLLMINAQNAAMNSGPTSKMMNFGKSRAKMIKENKYRLKRCSRT